MSSFPIRFAWCFFRGGSRRTSHRITSPQIHACFSQPPSPVMTIITTTMTIALQIITQTQGSRAATLTKAIWEKKNTEHTQDHGSSNNTDKRSRSPFLPEPFFPPGLSEGASLHYSYDFDLKH